MRSGRTGERELPVEQDTEAGAHDDPDRRGLPAQVRSADGECGRSAAGATDAAVVRACRSFVPGRHDDERVELGRAGDSQRHRPVREGGERLGDADDRNARGIQDVTVGVRVDRALEAGQQLVGAAVDGEAAVGARLPAGDSDRQDRRARGDALEAARAATSRDQPCHLRAVALEPRRIVWMRAARWLARRD